MAFDRVLDFINAVNREVFSARAMQTFGGIARDIMRKRTKSGRAYPLGALKPLSSRYIARRSKTGVPGEFGAPSRSNLTYTGQLLDSFTISSGQFTFTVTIPNTRRRNPPDRKGQKVGAGYDKHTNRQIADYVTRNGRPFFGITQDEKRIVVNAVDSSIRKVLNRFL